MAKDQELWDVCNFVETKPTKRGTSSAQKSLKVWWVWSRVIDPYNFTGYSHDWIPAKDPRTDIAVGMEVFKKIRKDGWWTAHLNSCGDSCGCIVRENLGDVYCCGQTFSGFGKTEEQAIFEAAVKLIEWLKGQ